MDDTSLLLTHLAGITERLAAVRSVSALAQTVHDIVTDTVDVEYLSVYLYDFELERIRLFVTKGFTKEEAEEAERTFWDRHPGWVIRNAQMLHIPDVDQNPISRDSRRSFVARSRLFLPIMSEGQCIGTTGLASLKLNHFDERDIAVLRYAAGTAGFMHKNLRDNHALGLQLDLAREQRRELMRLSSPVVEVWDGILVLPLIGRIDVDRSEQITHTLLKQVTERRTRLVILDFTGIDAIEVSLAQRIHQIRGALSLLGCRCVFSGIRPPVARLISDELDQGLSLQAFATLRHALRDFLGSERRRG